jgi:hypothetical protein
MIIDLVRDFLEADWMAFRAATAASSSETQSGAGEEGEKGILYSSSIMIFVLCVSAIDMVDGLFANGMVDRLFANDMLDGLFANGMVDGLFANDMLDGLFANDMLDRLVALLISIMDESGCRVLGFESSLFSKNWTIEVGMLAMDLRRMDLPSWVLKAAARCWMFPLFLGATFTYAL